MASAIGGRGVADARDVVLGRIRDALTRPLSPPEIPRAYASAASSLPVDELVELFAERAASYRSNVLRSDEDELGAILARICAERALRRVAVVDGLPAIPAVEARRDDPPLSVAELEGLDGVVTGCALAIATTGTIVLDGGTASGRRSLTLVPDVHICVVRASQVVADLPSAVAELHAAAVAGRPLTLVSGPSATSDIELERVEGVHGPRNLDIVLVDDVRDPGRTAGPS
jgi:L-lactate dehydrogenase complex protein LldG